MRDCVAPPSEGMFEPLAIIRTLAQMQHNMQDRSQLAEQDARSDLDGDGAGSSSESSIPCHPQVIDYRGEKVVGFIMNGVQMICLPQMYELFLKNMVGGLHTVYTKLKRLDITPIVCNVEQVRALRTFGAIQPGVNRCKLIAKSDFDILLEDCSTNCNRPGRPPKRQTMDEGMMAKREKAEGEPSDVFQLMPFTQHLLVQQMLANATRKRDDVIRKTEEVREGSTPLNLTKDKDENTDSVSPDESSTSERCTTQSTPSSDGLSTVAANLDKLLSLLEEQLNSQREGQREREELRRREEEERTRRNTLEDELAIERKRNRYNFQRYCKAKREVLQLREQLLEITQSKSQ